MSRPQRLADHRSSHRSNDMRRRISLLYSLATWIEVAGRGTRRSGREEWVG